MKVLHLPLKKEWYNMIESGVKTEEYREIKKMTPRKRPKYYDYMGWKMQGFFIKEFVLEQEDDY